MKCASCNKIISRAKCRVIEVQPDGMDGLSLRGIAYSCPLCSAVWSVQADPFSLNADLVAQIKRASR
jgi:hypothetical protein